MSTNEQNFNGNQASNQPPSQNQPISPVVAVPWWHRPWVWAILGALLVLAGYLLGSCARDPGEGSADMTPDSSQEELLLKAQQGVNDGLQAEIDRLRGLLSGDVCQGVSTEPLYGKPLPPDTGPGQVMPPPENMELPDAPTGPKEFSVPPTDATIEPLKAPENLQKPETIAALAEQATVLVLSISGPEEGQMGTGFFYAPGLIVTNAHVVNEYKELYVINKSLGRLIPGKVVACGKNANEDFAVIKLEDPDAAKIYPLTFTTKVARTDRVSAWGYPGLITAADPKLLKLLEGDKTAAPEIVYSEGVVSMIVDDNPQLIVHTAEISQGNSGGPTMDQNGRVVGINTLIMPDMESNRQANLCLGSRDVLSFLSRHKSGAVVEE